MELVGDSEPDPPMRQADSAAGPRPDACAYDTAVRRTSIAIPRLLKIVLKVVLLTWLAFLLTVAWLVVSSMRAARQAGGLAAVSAGISEAFVEAFLILTAILLVWGGWSIVRRYRDRSARTH